MHSVARPVQNDLLDGLAAVVWEADPRTFQFTYVSRGAEALLGYSLQDWLSRPAFWVELLHPDDRDAAVAHCRAAVADGRNHDFEYRVITADGSVRWLRDIVSVGRDGAGGADRLSGLMIDVTSARAAEAGRDPADRYRRAVVEHGLDLTVITDTRGTILFETPSVRKVLGLSGSTSRERNIFEMIHPGDAARLQRLFSAASSSVAATAPVQLRYRHCDGSWRLLDALGQRVEDEQGVMTVISARDVTDRVQLEEDFRRAQKTEALARITSAVARDFDNLLTVIRGNVALALEDTGHDKREELLAIRKAAEVGSAMIGQLMTFGGRKRRSVVVDVNTTLQTLGSILERFLGPFAALKVDTQAGHSRVCMEGGALEQILINLVVNSRQAMRAGGRVLITTRNVRMAGPGTGHTLEPLCDFVEIEVADTGTGMTPEVQQRIAELSFTTKHGTRGPGHGLARVCAIVSEAGGTIAVDTEPGKGTTFSIRLPLVQR